MILKKWVLTLKNTLKVQANRHWHTLIFFRNPVLALRDQTLREHNACNLMWRLGNIAIFSDGENNILLSYFSATAATGWRPSHRYPVFHAFQHVRPCRGVRPQLGPGSSRRRHRRGLETRRFPTHHCGQGVNAGNETQYSWVFGDISKKETQGGRT